MYFHINYSLLITRGFATCDSLGRQMGFHDLLRTIFSFHEWLATCDSWKATCERKKPVASLQPKGIKTYVPCITIFLLVNEGESG